MLTASRDPSQLVAAPRARRTLFSGIAIGEIGDDELDDAAEQIPSSNEQLDPLAHMRAMLDGWGAEGEVDGDGARVPAVVAHPHAAARSRTRPSGKSAMTNRHGQVVRS